MHFMFRLSLWASLRAICPSTSYLDTQRPR
jgi:hypothetical protein